MTPTLRSSLLLLVLSVGACGLDTSSESAGLDADVTTDSDISMSIDAIESMSLPDGTAVIVPLDQSVLALDADALAEVASEGNLVEVLEAFVLVDAITEADIVDGTVLRTVGDLDFTVRVDGDTTSIGAGRLIDVRRHGGLTILVADGLFES